MRLETGMWLETAIRLEDGGRRQLLCNLLLFRRIGSAKSDILDGVFQVENGLGRSRFPMLMLCYQYVSPEPHTLCCALRKGEQKFP